MEAAAAAGKIHICRWLHKTYGVPYTKAVLLAAARRGDLAMVRSVAQNAGCPCDRAAYKAALARDHKLVCFWLLASGHVPHLDTIVAAAEAGRPLAELQRNLMCLGPCDSSICGGSSDDAASSSSGGDDDDSGEPRSDGAASSSGGGDDSDKWWRRVLPAAAEGCDLPTLLALFKRAAADARGLYVSLNERSQILATAITSLTPDWRDKAEWLVDLDIDLLTSSTEIDFDRLLHDRSGGLAAVLERLAWLHGCSLVYVFWREARFRKLLREPLRVAAECGDLASLNRCLELLGPDAEAMTMLQGAAERAATKGQLAAVLLLHARGAAVDEDIVEAFARSTGQVAAVEALLAALGPAAVLTQRVTRAAAQSGSVELVSWMAARGCELDEHVFAAAARGGSEEMLGWLAGRGCDRALGCANAARNGDLRTLHCLRRLRCFWDRGTFTLACRWGAPLPALRWMAERGCPSNAAGAIEAAQQHPDARVRVWLEGRVPRFWGRRDGDGTQQLGRV